MSLNQFWWNTTYQRHTIHNQKQRDLASPTHRRLNLRLSNLSVILFNVRFKTSIVRITKFNVNLFKFASSRILSKVSSISTFTTYQTLYNNYLTYSVWTPLSTTADSDFWYESFQRKVLYYIFIVIIITYTTVVTSHKYHIIDRSKLQQCNSRLK